ncbi:MAG TPA: YrrS family protein [Pseudogracilibacillus sp.]|nr:YrrS family protein [Pseudogracilibacillus sp.]
MVDNYSNTRTSRHQKKHNKGRNLIIFGALALLFIAIVFSLIVLNKSAEPTENELETTEQSDVNDDNSDNQNQLVNKDDESDEEEALEKEQTEEEEKEEQAKKEAAEKEKKEKEEQEKVKETQGSSNDSNVVKSYSGDWSPVGTTQKGTHKTNYSNGSKDRKEIKKAVSQVTGVSESDMIEWRVENGGNKKVEATITNGKQTETYRVYLTWIDNKGWKVTKYEELKRNDKK